MAHYAAVQIKGFNGLVVEELEVLHFGKELAYESLTFERAAIVAYLRSRWPPDESSPDEYLPTAVIEEIEAGKHHGGVLEQRLPGIRSFGEGYGGVAEEARSEGERFGLYKGGKTEREAIVAYLRSWAAKCSLDQWAGLLNNAADNIETLKHHATFQEALPQEPEDPPKQPES